MIKPSATHVIRIYLSLALFNTLAASLIWGVNTLFLLEAGLSNTQAFLANAFFTIGQVIFEVPTGIVADIKGRRTSYLLGTLTLAASTLLYLLAWYVKAPMIIWAGSSVLLGLGFTFFSGATEAWLVDALEASGYKKSLDDVFAKSQIISGVAMLAGSVGGGIIAQTTNLGVPYVVRAILLLLTFIVAFIFMHDWGFEPTKSANLVRDVRTLFKTSFNLGLRNSAVRWIMLSAPLISGVSFYTFYALQPYLLELYGDETAYAVAGLAAAIVAGAQIVGGLTVPYIRRVFKLRSSVLLVATLSGTGLLLLVGVTHNFWLAIGLLCVWGLTSSAAMPVRQAYLNALIPSKQRATVLSFDSLLSSSGGIVVQPVLGRVADLQSYGMSFMVGSIFQLFAVPFFILTRRERSEADRIK